MSEYIFSIDGALYDDETGQIAMHPKVEGKLIRCKDCKHYVLHVLFGRSQSWCERLCDEFDKSLAMATEDDDFCSWAEERKEK